MSNRIDYVVSKLIGDDSAVSSPMANNPGKTASFRDQSYRINAKRQPTLPEGSSDT